MRALQKISGWCLLWFCFLGGFAWLGTYFPACNIVTNDQVGLVLAFALITSSQKKPSE